MGFKLKNVVKSVTKAAQQVATVAVKPAAIVASASLNAVGARSAASNLGKFTHLSQTEQKIGKAAGTGIQIGGGLLVGAAVAPSVLAGAGTLGKGVAAGGGLLKGTLKTLGPTLAGLFKKGAPEGETVDTTATDSSGKTLGDITASLAGKLGKARSAIEKSGLLEKGRAALERELKPGGGAGLTEASAAGAPAGLPWWGMPLMIAAVLLMGFISQGKRR